MHSAGFAQSFQTLVAQFVVSLTPGADAAHDKLMGFLQPMQIKLRDDPTLGGTVDTIESDIRNQLLYGDWSGVKVAILEMEVDVKMTVPAS